MQTPSLTGSASRRGVRSEHLEPICLPPVSPGTPLRSRHRGQASVRATALRRTLERLPPPLQTPGHSDRAQRRMEPGTLRTALEEGGPRGAWFGRSERRCQPLALARVDRVAEPRGVAGAPGFADPTEAHDGAPADIARAERAVLFRSRSRPGHRRGGRRRDAGPDRDLRHRAARAVARVRARSCRGYGPAVLRSAASSAHEARLASVTPGPLAATTPRSIAGPCYRVPPAHEAQVLAQV